MPRSKKDYDRAKIKLLVACYSTLSRLGLSVLLSKEKDLVVVKETSNVNDTICWAEKNSTDILLLGAQLIIEGGIELISKIKRTNTKSKLVVFNSTFRLEQELLLVKEGVVGVVGANSTPEILIKGLRKVHAGDIWLRRDLIPSLIGSSHLGTHKANKAKVSGVYDTSLTKRESEVLSQIASGYKNWKISSNLCISEATVKTHINSIYRKLGISNRLQATLYELKYNRVSR